MLCMYMYMCMHNMYMYMYMYMHMYMYEVHAPLIKHAHVHMHVHVYILDIRGAALHNTAHSAQPCVSCTHSPVQYKPAGQSCTVCSLLDTLHNTALCTDHRAAEISAAQSAL